VQIESKPGLTPKVYFRHTPISTNFTFKFIRRPISPILSPSFRTFVELTLVNWRRPWGSRRLDFIIRAGSFNFSIGDISKFFLHRQDQQILRLPTAAATISHRLESARSLIIIGKIFIDQLNFSALQVHHGSPFQVEIRLRRLRSVGGTIDEKIKTPA
jgi:hypothetical protein